jgi:hypothetical protein
LVFSIRTKPIAMTLFNVSFLENWKDKGYNYILIMPRDKYGVLRPLSYDKPVQKGYTIQIDELQFIPVEADYFLVKSKDAMHVIEKQGVRNFA